MDTMTLCDDGRHVQLTVDRLLELLQAEEELEALQLAGVDNWGGYDGRWIDFDSAYTDMEVADLIHSLRGDVTYQRRTSD